MNTSISKPSIKMLLTSTLLVLLALATTACHKDESPVSTVEQSFTTDEQDVFAPKSADGDTIHFDGTLDGCKYNIIIVIDRESCTFTFEGDVTTTEGSFHVSGYGDIKVRNFHGTILDSNGHNVPLTDEWIKIIYKAIDLTGVVEQQVMSSISTE